MDSFQSLYWERERESARERNEKEKRKKEKKVEEKFGSSLSQQFKYEHA